MVYDAYGMVRTPFGKSYEMKVEAEAALVHGTTDLGATPDIPVHDLVQLGAAARLTMNSQSWGTVTDVVYASGDANADDEGVHNFKMDINYEMGMMLYRSILAAQSARTTFYASDPDLVGYPAQNLERTATRGALTNSMAVFPRLWYRVMDGLELYGGPLLAFAEVPQVEPFNTRIAGGEKRNAIRGVPGTFYGTEVDLGVRWTGLFWGTEVQLGAEGGVFVPGTAFNGTGDTTMDNVFAWRAVSSVRF